MQSSTSTEYPAPYLIPDHEVDSFLASFSASSLSSTLSPYPLDPFDHPNLQNLPSPYSPMRHAVHFDRKEEESVDGYEIFSTPIPTPDRTPQMSPIQHHEHQHQHQRQHFQQFQFQQHLSPHHGIYNDGAHSHTSHASNELLERPISPHNVFGPLEIQQQKLAQLHQQQVQQQQQRQFQLDQKARMGMGFPSYQPQYISSVSPQHIPSMSPQNIPSLSPPISSTLSSPLLLSSFPQFPSSSPLLPLESYDASQLGQYLTALEGQTHRPILENTIPAIDQDSELMQLSSLTLSSPDLAKRMSSFSSSFSPVELSPSLSSLSWTSSDQAPVPYSLSSSTPASASASEASSPKIKHTTPVGKAAKAASTRRKRLRPAHKLKKIKPTSFPCAAPGCDKIFKRAYNLTSHMKTHSAEKPFLCGFCPLAFARRHDRERHVRLHTGDKPYSCEGCGTGFMRNDALHRHKKLCGEQGEHGDHEEHGLEHESFDGEANRLFLNIQDDVMEQRVAAVTCLPNSEP